MQFSQRNHIKRETHSENRGGRDIRRDTHGGEQANEKRLRDNTARRMRRKRKEELGLAANAPKHIEVDNQKILQKDDAHRHDGGEHVFGEKCGNVGA